MKTKWKCNVCGEIFSSLPEICPVCGANRQAFSQYLEETPSFSKDTQEKFVIAGGGIAALQAVKAIRARNKTAEITMVFSENKIPYNRPALSDLIENNSSFSDIVLENYNFYKNNNIKLIKGVAITDIEKTTQTAILSNGDALKYDKLLIATGANAFNPFKISNECIPIQTLRSYDDAEKLLNLFEKKGKKIIIAGGGILGIEAAVAFHNKGAEVTLIERGDYIVKAQLDEYGSEKLRQIMEKNHIKIVTGCTVKDVDNKGVLLDSGIFIQADFMLVSMGIRSQLALAQKAGLNVNRAIIIDEYMRSSQENIYAAGDCAEFNGSSGGLWIISSEQGKIAGANMAGDKQKYQTVPFATAFQGLGINFFAVGNIKNDINKIETFRNEEIYKKLTFIDNKLVGVLLWNDTSLSNTAMELVKNKVSFNQAVKSLL